VQEPVVFGHLKNHFDDTMAVVYRELKKANVTLGSFWNIHGHVCGMWLPFNDVLALLNAKGSWADHEASLSRVCVYKTGRAMFEWALARVVEAKLGSIMEDLSKKLSDIPELDNTKANEACCHARVAITDLSNINLLGSKRIVSIYYRGRCCKHVVSTIEDEIQRRKMSEAKGRAVQSKKLAAMWFEEDLIDGYLLTHSRAGCNLKLDQVIQQLDTLYLSHSCCYSAGHQVIE
jgi:hypothetical protein